MKGCFIALEGSDGSGKTTVLHGIKERMKTLRLPVEFTREPGGTPIGEKIRSIILDTTNQEMTARCEALLYAASRAQHTEEKIRPALEKGKILICDRYVLSSLAYQGFGRKLGLKAVAEINAFARNGLLPDMTLFLDVDPVTVLRRKAKTETKDRLEEANDSFFEAVYRGYLESMQDMPNVVRIDASQPAEKVLEDAWEAICRTLVRHGYCEKQGSTFVEKE